MKYLSISLLIALFSSLMVNAQQVAVVNELGETSVFDDISEAIEGAEDGSTIYLNGGGHNLISGLKVTKKITLMGCGHNVNTENADGHTLISGDLQFCPGSDGSSIVGVYMPNGIKIGVDGVVSEIFIRNCNVDNIQVKTSNCPGLYVNQTYARSEMQFLSSNATVQNCVIKNLYGTNAGSISHCVISGSIDTSNTSFYHNLRWNGIGGSGNTSMNDRQGDFSAIINKWDGISITSDFHYVEGYEGDSQIGIYGGTDFDDSFMPPIPIIVSKSVPGNIDAQGNLPIEVKVKSK